MEAESRSRDRREDLHVALAAVRWEHDKGQSSKALDEALAKGSGQQPTPKRERPADPYAPKAKPRTMGEAMKAAKATGIQAKAAVFDKHWGEG